jgi:hypothetical protein
MHTINKAAAWFERYNAFVILGLVRNGLYES